MGLAGLFIVSDEEESAAGLPSGAYDIPLILQDRSFDKDNQLAYIANPMGAGMMQNMMGFLGDRILVNGKPDFTLPVATRIYRLRLINGSNSRIYKLAWDDGTPLTVIGTDGGLIEKPVQRSYVTLAPGERIELWADFSGRKVRDDLALRSLEFSGAEGVGANGAMGAGISAGQVTTGTIDRQILPELAAGWNSVREGYVDDGWKDTFLLMPGERVKLLLRFKDNTGLFVYHCHNLEHESAGMMRNYRVTS